MQWTSASWLARAIWGLSIVAGLVFGAFVLVELARVEGARLSKLEGVATATGAVAPDGERTAVIRSDNSVDILDSAGSVVGRVRGHNARIISAKFSPPGELITIDAAGVVIRQDVNSMGVLEAANQASRPDFTGNVVWDQMLAPPARALWSVSWVHLGSGAGEITRAVMRAPVLPPGLKAPQGAMFRDCELCPEMVALPGSVFREMPGFDRDRSIAVGRFEASVAEFRRFLDETGYAFDGACSAPDDALAAAAPAATPVSTPAPAIAPRIQTSPRTPQRTGRVIQPYAGPPYQVGGMWYIPAHEPNYDEVGIASSYGPSFQGKSSASGEIVDPDALMAAHPTLPIPSLVRVTNLENGRSAVVRLNDRGPFADDRIIDLSRGAAVALGMTDKATAKVRVQYVGPATDDVSPAEETAPPASAAPAPSLTVAATPEPLARNNSKALALSAGDDLPIVCVSRPDVVAYLDWLSQASGISYRLLTETEWEALARQYDRDLLSADPEGCGHIVGFGMIKGEACPVQAVSQIGSRRSGLLGVFDLFGNVWEMVDGCTMETSSDLTTTACGQTSKGGSALSAIARSAIGQSAGPEFNSPSTGVGFRVVRDLRT